ncbi:MAG: Dabb family protein [Granulosicoccus sp.]
MIRHCVFIRFKSEVNETQKAELFSEIDALKNHLAGILAVHIGHNVSPETGMDKGFSDGFIVDFKDAASRDAYLEDEDHQKTGGRLVEASEGGVDGILVYDLEIAD